MKVVITGGHHSSAIPVVRSLAELFPEVEVFWMGHRHSLKGDKNDTLEYIEIKALRLPFFDLKAGKVYKTFDPMRLVKLPLGLFQAFYYLLKIKPDVILSFGGYLAVPVVVAGWVLGIPSVTHEQTVVAGYANKVIAFFAKSVLVAWPESLKYFPKNKTAIAGLPLRKSIFEVKSSAFVAANNLPTVYVTAGKTGSHTINTVIAEGMSELLTFCNLVVQCGDYSIFNDYDTLAHTYGEINPIPAGKLFLKKFVLEDEIGEALNKAILVISRAGAHIVGELLALKKPCILIPIPWVSHNEQAKNAEMLKNAGLAHVIEEKELTAKLLVLSVRKMLENLDMYMLSESVNLVEHANAADLIAREVIKTGIK